MHRRKGRQPARTVHHPRTRGSASAKLGDVRTPRVARVGLAASLVVGCGLIGTACGQRAGHASQGSRGDGNAAPRTHDAESARMLLRIARTFNNDYQQNKDTAVYGRWDAASQSIISRATYVRRHHECPNTPHVKVDTWGVTHGPDRAWLVHYSIDGHQSTDWWYYVHGRFVFDLFKSNPSAVALYRASPAQYVKDVGCGH